MSLPRTLTDREQDKFEEGPLGETRVRVTSIGSITGDVNIVGPGTSARVSYVTLNSATWTAIPAVALADRKSLSIQNQSSTQIKYDYDNSVVGYNGVIINPSGERFLEIQESLIVYGKAQSGTCVVLVEELA